MAMISRRALFKFGAGVSVAALMPGMEAAAAKGEERFSTGFPDLDAAIGGGLRGGTLTVVIGPEKSGKTAFLYKLAKANGVMDASHMGKGRSDMLSIMRQQGKAVGHLMSDSEEPATEVERLLMASNPSARNAFLHRWFKRTQEVLRESGGIFVFSVVGTYDATPNPNWLEVPEYVIALDGSRWEAKKG